MVGESKNCTSIPLDRGTPQLRTRAVGYIAESIICDDGPFHTMHVKLYGRLYQPENKLATWKCVKETDSFTCRQSGAE